MTRVVRIDKVYYGTTRFNTVTTRFNKERRVSSQVNQGSTTVCYGTNTGLHEPERSDTGNDEPPRSDKDLSLQLIRTCTCIFRHSHSDIMWYVRQAKTQPDQRPCWSLEYSINI